MIELFKKTYQDGAEVYLNPKEKDELIEYIKSLEQDNERINNDATHLIELHKKTTEENNKLNNVINKLNYGIKELDNMFYETFRISQNGYYSISKWELKGFTDKIKELKEGVKK